MNTLAEVIEHHIAQAESERRAMHTARKNGFFDIAAHYQQRTLRHMDAVATLQRAVADIERLQKAWEATR